MRIIKYQNNQKNSKDSPSLRTVLNTLKSGGLVVFPSDTVYGLLADARNPKAINKLFAFKRRPAGKAISIFVADKKMADKYVVLTTNALNIINNLLPGPFTVVCQSKHQTDLRLEAENGTLGFRTPNYPLINQLTNQLGFPITATSANVSGTPHHYSVNSLLSSIYFKKKQLIDLIIDAGKLPYNLPSTVIDTTTPELITLRRGNIIVKSFNILISKSEADTRRLGHYIGTLIQNKSTSKPVVILLTGNLGAGKTVFVKGLAKALNINENIASPTYNLINEYIIPYSNVNQFKTTSTNKVNTNYRVRTMAIIPQKLIHIDLYRLNTPQEVAEIGINNYISAEYQNNNVIAIEWSDRISDNLLKKYAYRAKIYYINIQHTGINNREIEWQG